MFNPFNPSDTFVSLYILHVIAKGVVVDGRGVEHGLSLASLSNATGIAIEDMKSLVGGMEQAKLITVKTYSETEPSGQVPRMTHIGLQLILGIESQYHGAMRDVTLVQ